MKAVKGSYNRGDGGESVRLCGLEVSSWFVWLAAGQKECQGNSGWLRGEGRASLGDSCFFFW
jgi:hypothetical protein